MNKHLPVFVVAFLLTACAEPLPENKLHYAGDWQSKEMALLILEDGSVAYKRLKDGATTSVNGPLKEFIGDDFVVGVSFLTTAFDVSEPPHEEKGVWRMTVDDVQLTKVNE
ncbi:MAG: hypothetical protein GY712_07020 [Oceanicoccus sp.]|uniref:hypothetical protein n=1 Tax=Oceanicoccus sp. TaxID=2691044 RepID=UPI00261BA751|nr:hypothetical protein [Oceanicoccus sp.]MCP3907753.1 hypothetical protein [Oceanicoccus sp.]